MISAITLQLFSCELTVVQEELEQRVEQGRGFFSNALIIIDFTRLNDFLPDVKRLIELIKGVDMIPIGYYCDNDEHRQLLESCELTLIRKSRGNNRSLPVQSEKSWSSPLMHKLPVRSGQQIYARQCDLVLTAQASNGSELIADGSIHVYGALRGRALCGVSGNEEAMIFCQKFDAELIAIAGIYRLVDEGMQEFINKAVQIRLVDQQIVIEPLS